MDEPVTPEATMSVAGRLLTPSKISAWLDCAHYLSLKHQVEDGSLQQPASSFGELAQLLMAKGEAHELACLEDYRSQGLRILEVDGRRPREAFADWVQCVGDPFADGYDVIFQMPFVHDGIRGIVDFLIRTENPSTGVISYEPVDAKRARAEAKPAHILQLCFYADAIEVATGHRCEQIHVWLGSGKVESFRSDDFSSYWNRLRMQLRTVLGADSTEAETTPEPIGPNRAANNTRIQVDHRPKLQHSWSKPNLLAHVRLSSNFALEVSRDRAIVIVAPWRGGVSTLSIGKGLCVFAQEDSP